MNWLFIAVLFSVVFVAVFCCRGLFVLQGKCAKKVVLHHMQQAGTLEFLHHHEMLLHNLWSFVHHSAYGSPSGWLLQKWENWPSLGTKIWTATEQQLSAWMRKVMETRAEFHFSLVYTFSTTLSSVRNWANNDRYRLRPSTPMQLCWSSSRLQPFQNYNLIKFALIRPPTLNHDINSWNFRGALDETTCFAGFFGVPAP